jgi:hypothetical protein
MRKSIPAAVVVGIALSLGAAVMAMAHEGEGGAEAIAVEPSTVTAGDTVILAGRGLEPDSDRVIVLAGQDLVVAFGTVTTDAEGMFQKELTIPGHLPAGTYELRAIGDETLTVPLGVVESAVAEATPAPNAVPAPIATAATDATPAANAVPAPIATAATDATPAAIDTTRTVIPRERSPIELAVIAGLVALAAAIGGLLVWRAERLGGAARA